jgi:hypothetical protein
MLASWTSTIPSSSTPLNFFGDIKTGYFNYNDIISLYGTPGTMSWVDKVYSSKMSEKTNNDLFFRGYLYGERLDLSSLKILNITGEKVFPTEKYFEELTNNRINLSLNGAAEICNRDIEILGSRSVLFRPYLKQKFHNELIPDYHYIGFEFNPDARLQTEIILDKFNSIKDNIDLLTNISENGYEWFKSNGTVDSNVDILCSILNEDKINQLI